MEGYVTVCAGAKPNEFGLWHEILVTDSVGDGFWFNVSPSSSATITVEVGMGPHGCEMERCDIEVHPGRPQHVLVFERVPVGSRLAARIKSAVSRATAGIRAGVWNRPAE